MPHLIVWPLSLTLMAMLAGVFAYVAANSGNREHDYKSLQYAAYRIRARFFWALVLIFGPVMVYNLLELPFDGPATRDSAASGRIIEAKGYQWRWELSQEQANVGETVEFRLTSGDVNHGFGIYDPDMRLVAQVQVMPGYTNKLHYTFTREGVYKILCMEYCGIAHHNMITEIKVSGTHDRG